MRQFLKFLTYFLLAVPLLLIGDSIQLTDGSTVNGRLLDQDADHITIKTDDGQIMTLPKISISKVKYRSNKKNSKDDTIPYYGGEPIDANNSNGTNRKSSDNQPVRETKIIERIIERAPSSVASNSGQSDPSLNGRVEVLEGKTEAHSKLIDRDYELRKEELKFRNNEMELRKKENEKFEQLLIREERLQKEEFEYLKKEKRLRELEKEKEEELKKLTDKRIAELEIRNKRLERYLDMDETMVNYYAYPRSPWQLVYRSALFPGWGQRYAKEEFFGNFYGISVFTFAVLGSIVEYQAKQVKAAIDDKLVTDVIINPLSTNALFASSGGSSSLLTTYQANQAAKKINDANDARDLADTQLTLGRRMTQLAVAIYLVQIVHAYVIGIEWSKVRPRDYSEKGLKGGLSLDVTPDYGIKGQTSSIGTRSELRYNFSF